MLEIGLIGNEHGVEIADGVGGAPTQQSNSMKILVRSSLAQLLLEPLQIPRYLDSGRLCPLVIHCKCTTSSSARLCRLFRFFGFSSQFGLVGQFVEFGLLRSVLLQLLDNVS